MKNEFGRFIVAAGAIIENEKTGKILLIKRTPKEFFGGEWESVTGRMHQFELPEQGLRREIFEETGLKVKIMKPIRIFHMYRGKKSAKNEVIGLIYWCKTKSNKIKLSHEHTDFKWVSAKQAIKIVKCDGIKEDIKAFVNAKKCQ